MLRPHTLEHGHTLELVHDHLSRLDSPPKRQARSSFAGPSSLPQLGNTSLLYMAGVSMLRCRMAICRWS